MAPSEVTQFSRKKLFSTNLILKPQNQILRCRNQASESTLLYVTSGFSFTIHFDDQFELKFSQVCYCMHMLRYNERENWSLTITNSVQCLKHRPDAHDVILVRRPKNRCQKEVVYWPVCFLLLHHRFTPKMADV